jgi:hypothetical protein
MKPDDRRDMGRNLCSEWMANECRVVGADRLDLDRL